MIQIVSAVLILIVILIIAKWQFRHLKPHFRQFDMSIEGMIKALSITLALCAVFSANSLWSSVFSEQYLSENAYGETTAMENSEQAEEETGIDAQSVSMGSGRYEDETGTDSDEPVVADVPEPAVVYSAASSEGNEALPSVSASPAVMEGATAAKSLQSADAPDEPVTQDVVQTVAAGLYRDGSYTGTANGFRGPMTVAVEVQNGKIASVQVTDHRDDRKWFNRAYTTIVERILQAQSTNVDVVSGATYSSLGIIRGAADALSSAQ